MDLSLIEKGLLIYEKRLKQQELRRKILGVKEVERPTYERYITGPVKRYNRKKNAFALLAPNNPFGDEFKQTYLKRTGAKSFSQPLPMSELEPEDRINQSLGQAAWRLCQEYHPEPKPTAPPEAQVPVNDPAQMSRLIKKVAMWFGAELVKIAKLDQRWVYEDVDIPHKYVILCVVPHLTGFNKTAPSHLSAAAVGNTYSRLTFITTQLADFIRGLGYDAASRETRGGLGELLVVPAAIDAGVGEFARNGRCLSPEFGINMRVKPVTTDLPLEVDKPISLNIHEFCMACESCAKYCPVNAIPTGEPTEAPDSICNNPGYKKWYVKAERCLLFWAANRKKWTSCGGRCIAVCPWNKPLNLFHNTVRWAAIHAPHLIKKILVWGDEIVYQRTVKLN